MSNSIAKFDFIWFIIRGFDLSCVIFGLPDCDFKHFANRCIIPTWSEM